MHVDNKYICIPETRPVPIIYSHRGKGTGAFENTISSFLCALKAGANGIEIDVCATKEGKLICFHDAELSRVAGNKQPIRNVHLRVIRSIPLEGNERIPTLKEALIAIDPEVPLILDVKTNRFRDKQMLVSLIGILKNFRLEREGEITVVSTNYFFLYWLAKSLKEIRIGFILKPNSSHTGIGMNRLFSKNYSILCPHVNLVNEHNVTKWKKMNFKIIPWVVNDSREAKKFANWGVDGLVTDTPEAISTAFKS